MNTPIPKARFAGQAKKNGRTNGSKPWQNSKPPFAALADEIVANTNSSSNLLRESEIAAAEAIRAVQEQLQKIDHPG